MFVSAQLQILKSPHIVSQTENNIKSWLLKALRVTSAKYTVKSPVALLRSGVWEINLVVYFNSKIVAFVEINGPQYYIAHDRQLVRQDELEEYLFSKYYPGVTMLRISVRDKNTVRKLCEELAAEIVNLS